MMHRERAKKILRTIRAACAHPAEFAKFSLAFGETGMKDRVRRRYGLELGLPALDLLDLFPDFRECVSPFTYLEGGSTAIDLALLKTLAKRYESCRYFEIGAWRGESVANVASVASECISLSLSDEQMREAGWPESYLATARFFSSRLKNVVHIGGDSKSFDFRPYYGSCDLVFIDGDHSYDGVRSDTTNAFRLLRDDRSVVVWHDFTRTPESDILWGVFAGILDGAPPEAIPCLYRITNTLCAVYIRGTMRATATDYPAVPNKEFSVEIVGKRVRR
jgi:Methyltransferase domain